MARRRSGAGSGLSRFETILGFCYLPSYFFLLPLLLEAIFSAVGVRLTDLTLNLAYYCINFIVILLIFHRFLLDALRRIQIWDFVQAVILGFVFYYALSWLVSFLILRVSPDLQNPNNQAVDVLTAAGGLPMTLCVVLLAPVVEESLMRGLIFGTIRPHSRLAAYLVSVFVFAAMHLWQYLLSESPLTLLLSFLQYIPGGVALAWTYEKADSIWGSVLLHCAINAVALGVLSLI